MLKMAICNSSINSLCCWDIEVCNDLLKKHNYFYWNIYRNHLKLCIYICVYPMTSSNMQLKLCVIYLYHLQIHDFSTEVIMHSCDIIKTVLQRCVFFTYVTYVCSIRVNERVYMFWGVLSTPYVYVRKKKRITGKQP